ncbi:formate C-acetyltransferase/glycerol dehydratase family glycyl radical enzyme [Klebsiella huaxiensis]|uniref:glycyl radical protein n=1 Tax=Klebsiella huaxiensis TaxID=2153354 RepID=UPI000DD3B592|nr:formate C-acetyltransferase/glycerol dehydratase family glycyl radical enzyme [Klebsiella huaxiensis]QBG07942.1 formate C-acetyltransferase/glycerol dehydratase family glycyl radical enzyme [Klebsiella huaxiensis]VUT15041.1 Choline trimethylamine-lyase [Klebsiella huaxiensis]
MKDFLEFKVINHDDIDLARIDRLRHKMQTRRANICSERAILYTESFKQTEGEAYILRKAKAFAHTLKNMSIYFEKDSLIFGNQASANFAAPIFPEYSYQWVIDELDQFDKRTGDIFYITEDVKEKLRSIQDYWLGKTHADEVKRTSPQNIVLAEKQGVLHRGGISMSGDGHIVPDHEMIFKYGFRGLIDQAAEKLRQLAPEDVQQRQFYEAAIITLEASLEFIKRYGRLASQEAEIEPDSRREKELIAIAEMCETLLEKPVEHFYEGCQACYLVHILQMIESNGHSFCYGRFDQYMIPLYLKDIADRTLTQEKALEILTHLFLMNSGNNKVRPYGHTKFSQGYPLYSNLMVGGRKRDGQDGTNALSYLCIEAMNLTAMAEPNFSMRFNQDTPKGLLKLAARLIRTGCGMPSMFNDEVAVKGLEDLGIPTEDALDYCAIGCVETGVPGKYGHRATGMTYVNWGKMLELVLNNGMDPASGIQLISVNGKEGNKTNYQYYEQLWSAWETLLKYYSDLAVECDAICDRSLAVYDTSPFASCFIDNCLKLGKALKDGGCKYDIISQSNIGPSVVGNSLAVIKKLVFEEKTVSLDEIMAAMNADWQGQDAERILRLVKKVPKFGNDDDYVDMIVKDVFDSYIKLLPQYTTERTGKGPEVSCYTMSTSNITSYIPNGFDVGATPDGRRAKTPLNEGCSPTQGTDTQGPTAVINSVAKLPNVKVAAGQLLNMRFSPGSLAGEENLDKFVSFLRALVMKGIYHCQFNVIDSKTLLDAKVHPENYADLIVRVAGYCAQYISLMPEAQDAIIARTTNQWR